MPTLYVTEQAGLSLSGSKILKRFSDDARLKCKWKLENVFGISAIHTDTYTYIFLFIQIFIYAWALIEDLFAVYSISLSCKS